MNIAIVDDEIKERELLAQYMGEWAKAKKKELAFFHFESSENFLFGWEDKKDYDLLVLDIEMGEMNGYELAKKIRQEDQNIPLVFVTGYDEYMQYGYDVAALHYLMKPVNKEKLFQVLDKLSRQKKEEKILLFHTEEGMKKVPVGQLIYIEASGHNSIIHMAGEVVTVKEAIGSIEKQLAETKEIVKNHRAYLVNLQFVSVIQNTNLMLDNGEVLPISRGQVKAVQQTFIQFYK